MTYIPGMGHVKDYPAEPPEADYGICERCDEEVQVDINPVEGTVTCTECGDVLAERDWEGEAEARHGW